MLHLQGTLCLALKNKQQQTTEFRMICLFLQLSCSGQELTLDSVEQFIIFYKRTINRLVGSDSNLKGLIASFKCLHIEGQGADKAYRTASLPKRRDSQP